MCSAAHTPCISCMRLFGGHAVRHNAAGPGPGLPLRNEHARSIQPSSHLSDHCCRSAPLRALIPRRADLAITSSRLVFIILFRCGHCVACAGVFCLECIGITGESFGQRRLGTLNTPLAGGLHVHRAAARFGAATWSWRLAWCGMICRSWHRGAQVIDGMAYRCRARAGTAAL